MIRKTDLSDDEIVEAFATTPAEQLRVHYRWEVAGLDAAVAAAEGSADPSAAQARVDEAVIDAARRGVSWSLIAASLGRFDLAELKRTYGPLV